MALITIPKLIQRNCENHSASIKSIAFAGATWRELDGKKKKRGKKQRKEEKTLVYKEGYSVPGV